MGELEFSPGTGTLPPSKGCSVLSLTQYFFSVTQKSHSRILRGTPCLEEKLLWSLSKEVTQVPFTSLLVAKSKERGKKLAFSQWRPRLKIWLPILNSQEVCASSPHCGRQLTTVKSNHNLYQAGLGRLGGGVITIKIDCIFLIQPSCRHDQGLLREWNKMKNSETYPIDTAPAPPPQEASHRQSSSPFPLCSHTHAPLAQLQHLLLCGSLMVCTGLPQRLGRVLILFHFECLISGI